MVKVRKKAVIIMLSSKLRKMFLIYSLDFNPSFRPSVGASFDQWKAAVENDPKLAGCVLAPPVRSKKQLEYYSSIVPPSPTLLGVVMANPMDAY
jgi:hypothetical protein